MILRWLLFLKCYRDLHVKFEIDRTILRCLLIPMNNYIKELIAPTLVNEKTLRAVKLY